MTFFDRTERDWDNSLIIKRVFFEIFDCFLPLFYIAFYQLNVVALRRELVGLFWGMYMLVFWGRCSLCAKLVSTTIFLLSTLNGRKQNSFFLFQWIRFRFKSQFLKKFEKWMINYWRFNLWSSSISGYCEREKIRYIVKSDFANRQVSFSPCLWSKDADMYTSDTYMNARNIGIANLIQFVFDSRWWDTPPHNRITSSIFDRKRPCVESKERVC